MNTLNGKLYIGSGAKCIGKRLKNHHWRLMRNGHHSPHLQAAWIKHGFSVFTVSILMLCPPNECIANEQRFIDQFKSANNEFGYNVCPTAGSRFGTRASPEVREKLKLAHLGVKLSPEHSANIAKGNTGKRRSNEFRMKMSAARMGIKLSQKAKDSMRAARVGRKLSPTHVQNMRLALTGKKRSQQQRVRCSEAAFKRELIKRQARQAKHPFTPSLF